MCFPNFHLLWVECIVLQKFFTYPAFRAFLPLLFISQADCGFRNLLLLFPMLYDCARLAALSFISHAYCGFGNIFGLFTRPEFVGVGFIFLLSFFPDCAPFAFHCCCFQDIRSQAKTSTGHLSFSSTWCKGAA